MNRDVRDQVIRDLVVAADDYHTSAMKLIRLVRYGAGDNLTVGLELARANSMITRVLSILWPRLGISVSSDDFDQLMGYISASSDDNDLHND